MVEPTQIARDEAYTDRYWLVALGSIPAESALSTMQPRLAKNGSNRLFYLSML
jgi:hypothetical protein